MLRGAAEEEDRKGSERKKLMVNIFAIVLNHQEFHSEVSSSVLKELVRRALESGQIYCLENGQVLLHQDAGARGR